MATKTLGEAIEANKDRERVVVNERGEKFRKGDLPPLERKRISLNKWWIFMAIFFGACQVVQAVFSVLSYFRSCGRG